MFPSALVFWGGAAAEVMYYNVLAPALQKACSKVAGSTMLPAAKEIPNYILRHGLLACANRIKILRQCSLTISFASGRYWTPTGRLLDAYWTPYWTPYWTVKQILACDTNPRSRHHN